MELGRRAKSWMCRVVSILIYTYNVFCNMIDAWWWNSINHLSSALVNHLNIVKQKREKRLMRDIILDNMDKFLTTGGNWWLIFGMEYREGGYLVIKSAIIKESIIC